MISEFLQSDIREALDSMSNLLARAQLAATEHVDIREDIEKDVQTSLKEIDKLTRDFEKTCLTELKGLQARGVHACPQIMYRVLLVTITEKLATLLLDVEKFNYSINGDNE